jgi:hypothetical protein
VDVEKIFAIAEFIFCLTLVTVMLSCAIAAAAWYVTGENLAFLLGS